MGKAKKGRKVEQENVTKDVSDSEDEVQESKVKTKAKGKKDELDVEDVSSTGGKKEKKKPKAEASKKAQKAKESDSDSEVEIKATKGGFATLAISDDDDDDKPESNDEQDDVVLKKDDKKGDKLGKKNKRKKKDDEDLDKILAELEMEYAGEAPPKQEEAAKEETDGKKKKKKDAKKDKKHDLLAEALEDLPLENENEDEVKTVKSAAQKKKEKKEREKLKRQAEKPQTKNEAPVVKELSLERSESEEKSEAKPEEVKVEGDEADDGKTEDDKKKKKKKKGEKVKEEKDDKSKPKKKTILAMQAALQKLKEEEEKAAALEAERLKKEDQAEQERLEQIRLEQERKERKKQKEKEKKERLKAEGKLLNSKQKADRARAQAMIEAMNAMRVAPAGDSAPAPKHKPFTKLKKKTTPPPQTKDETVKEEPKTVEVEIVEAPIIEVKEEPEEDVKDSWDIESDKEDEKSDDSTKKVETTHPQKKVTVTQKSKETETSDSETESESNDDDDSVEESDTDSDSDDKHDKKSDAARKREKVIERIRKRHEVAESKRTTDELRAAVVCVLGHVDTGKTKILDKLRRTNVQDGEAGGITQQIGATNVPIDAIKEQAKIVKGFSQMELKIPGLLIIDTPGHESFSNLRSRGSSLCDIAILVVDIMHGLEPQTIESINLLKQRKTPFIVALNKIDRLYDWEMMARKDIRDVIKSQAANTQLEFEQRTNEVIVQFAEQGLNAALFYNNPDVRSYVSLIPTSATTGEGMGNLLALIVESCQTMLAKRLMFSEELHATVLEVKALPGLGTTIDVILVNGYLREGETMVLAGTEAPIVTQIRSLLMPQPMKELRVKNAYVEYKEVKAAQGVKIAAKDLEKVIAGLNLRVAEKPDEVEILKEEVAHELKHALSNIKLQERGVYVQASTLGSLEALLEFLKSSNIPYANIRIGPVVKKDVMKASTMLEHDSMYAVILAFDVKIDRDAQEMADSLGVKIFQADIIYHLFDKFIAFRDEIKAKKREEFKSVAVFPCKLKILPQFVFNSRDPIVMGVMVEAGIVREGTPLCVPSKDFVEIGIVTSIENNHKPVESARKGSEVCIKIEPIPGEAPKMFGRHFDEKDFLVSKISRQSIDACKDYFRDDLLKTDWQLMVELKKLFQIL